MTELAAKGAIPKKQDGIIIGRSSGKREMAAAGAVLYMLVALLCASLVDGATDPNDGRILLNLVLLYLPDAPPLSLIEKLFLGLVLFC